MDKYEQEAYDRRKKEAVDYRTKKQKSMWFMLLSTIIEIVVTIAIYFVSLLLVGLIVMGLFRQTEGFGQIFVVVSALVLFFVSLFLGFLVYKRICRFIIKAAHMEDKLLPEVLNQYKTKAEREADEREAMSK
ncbi:MAG: hypothetical protein MJ162_04580 [Treponema sp.]|nr:hypothetical protein [Treponema sp.]